MRDVQDAIDFVAGSSLPNLPYYIMDPKDHRTLQELIEGLLNKNLVLQSKSPRCTSPTSVKQGWINNNVC